MKGKGKGKFKGNWNVVVPKLWRPSLPIPSGPINQLHRRSLQPCRSPLRPQVIRGLARSVLVQLQVVVLARVWELPVVLANGWLGVLALRVIKVSRLRRRY